MPRPPRVIKFSGGRSSGMMLLKMLDEGELDGALGDVVVFNNTSAEHSATYKFVEQCKQRCESYGVPMFWLEFCTYEGEFRKRLIRKNTYRLVDTASYKSKGEVFEELIVHRNLLPNKFQRVCTMYMKIYVSNMFLEDYWSGRAGPQLQGDPTQPAQMTEAHFIDNNQYFRSKVDDKLIAKRKKFLEKCLHYRPAQKFSDFTSVKLKPGAWRKAAKIGKAELYGKETFDFISYYGIRADERGRWERIKNRNDSRPARIVRYLTAPEGQEAEAPLVAAGITKENVISFWKEQDFDLELPESGAYSNCVYCFFKGNRLLSHLTQQERDIKPRKGSPESIDWWIKTEKKYANPSNSNGYHIGFFGKSEKPVYQEIKKNALAQTEMFDAEDSGSFSCFCTD